MFLFKFLILVVAISSFAFSNPRVYTKNSRYIDTPNINYQITSSVVTRSGDINWGTLNQQAMNFVSNNKSVFTELENRGSEIMLKNKNYDYWGITLRYKQRFNRVNVEGAELILSFDSYGTLTSVNNSLVNIPIGYSVTPALSNQQAYNIAVKSIGYYYPQIGYEKNDGLLISIDSLTAQPILLWQFSIREYYTKDKAYTIQVIADGPSTGALYKIREAGHKFIPIIDIYDGEKIEGEITDHNLGLLVINQNSNIGREIPLEATEAFNNFTKVANFYFTTFSHISFDTQNALISASVNITNPFIKENAAWVGPWQTFIFGSGGERLGNFTKALDVVGHEFTHAVIDTSSGLIYEGQSGALNEHLADVFGEMIEVSHNETEGHMLIGEKVVMNEKKPLRDMMNPSRGLSPQPGHVSETPDMFGPNCIPNQFNDNCGVHVLSGIMNRFAAIAIEQLGWAKLAHIFYRVMTQRLSSSATFIDYRNQIIEECISQLSPNECSIVSRAFDSVGVI